MQDFCTRHNLPDFKLVIRFSEQDSTRWSADYIRKQLNLHKWEDLKCVWACGPPPMSETFDKAFAEIKNENFNKDYQPLL